MAEKVQIDTTLTVKEIARTYSISKATASRAKKRGWYLANFKPPPGEPIVAPADRQRFLEIAVLPALNLNRIKSIPPQRFQDVKGGVNLYRSDWEAFQAEIAQLREDLRPMLKYIYTRDIKTILDHPLIHSRALLENNALITRVGYGGEARPEELEAARERIERFYEALL